MRLRLSPFPVRGLPLFFLALSLVGSAIGVLLQAARGWNLAWLFPYFFIFSAPFGAELREKELVLLYGFGLMKERIPLDSIEEVSILSRLEYGTVVKHFKAYAGLWALAVTLAVIYLVLPWEKNPIGLYFAPLIITLYTVFFLILTLPVKRRDVVYIAALFALAFLLLYPLFTMGPKALIPSFIFGLLIFGMVKAFRAEDLILLRADGKSHLLSCRDGSEFLRLLRRVGDAQAP